jgi:hypothetical protein
MWPWIFVGGFIAGVLVTWWASVMVGRIPE